MSRRLIFQIGLITMISLTSCKSETEPTFEGNVIIVGAGAAGLSAAWHLEKSGAKYQILEASDKIGGRLGKVEGFADYPLDTGAQWLHGNRSITAKFCKKNQVKYRKDNSSEMYWFDGAFKKRLPRSPYGIFDDSSAPDVSFSTLAKDEGFGPSYNNIINAISSSFGAGPDKISVKWSSIEGEKWSAGFSDYKFQKTYYDVFADHIAPSISKNIEFNSPVTKIDFSGEKVEVTVKGGKQHSADRVIVTVPITILKDGDITFEPALPREKLDAFQKLGMGPGMKVFLKFKSRFYHQMAIGGNVCSTYIDESVGKEGGEHVLLAFIMGDQAEKLSKLNSDDAITKALLTELDEMYANKASKEFLDSHVIDWTTKPYIRGAYSYRQIGSGNARAIAAKPVGNKIYFAGEAMNLNGHPQTVHGAMETGIETATQILKTP